MHLIEVILLTLYIAKYRNNFIGFHIRLATPQRPRDMDIKLYVHGGMLCMIVELTI